MARDEQSVTEILRNAGYGHRPTGEGGAHEIFSFNTMEVVGVARAEKALAVAGLEA